MSSSSNSLVRLLPGLVVCLTVGVVSMLVAELIPAISGLVVAIVLGILWRNLAPYPGRLQAGTKFTQKPILRLGIVLLGLQIPLAVVLDLGAWALSSIVAAVGLTFWVTMLVGNQLRMSRNQCLLLASGFSICGAAAVAGTDSVTDAEEDEVATAIAMVVVYGTLMILLMPALSAAFGLSQEQAGLWIGLSTHEVAQVVAAGGIVGGGALAVAVTVKLTRVLMLAPVLAGIAWSERRRGVSAELAGNSARRPPLVPLFVVGFVVCVAIASIGVLPGLIDAVLATVQTVLLASAMFALGLSVHVPSLWRVGGRPVLLGFVSTTFIVILGGTAVALPGLLGLS